MKMKKEEVFIKLLFLFKYAEKQMNRMLSGDDDELMAYGLEKIDLMCTKMCEMYEEAEE